MAEPVCAECKNVGAQFQRSGDAFFCHEDCQRTFAKQPLRAAQIGQELFDNPKLLVGYDIDTGLAGVCAQCIKAPIELSASLMGHSVGVCSQRCANELEASLKAARIESSLVPHHLRGRRSELATQQISGIWDSLKRRYHSGKDTAQSLGSKKYSSSTLSRLLYNIYLISECMPEAEREARELEYAQIAERVRPRAQADALAQLRQLGYRTKAQSAEAQLQRFQDFAKRIVGEKNQRSADKGREGKERAQANRAALCGSEKGEYGKRHGTRFDTISEDLQKEVVGMAVYYSTGDAAGASSKSGLSEHEKAFKGDLEDVFEDLRYRMGRERAMAYLLPLFESTGAVAAPLPVKAPPAATPKPAEEESGSEDEEEEEVSPPPVVNTPVISKTKGGPPPPPPRTTSRSPSPTRPKAPAEPPPISNGDLKSAMERAVLERRERINPSEPSGAAIASSVWYYK